MKLSIKIFFNFPKNIIRFKLMHFVLLGLSCVILIQFRSTEISTEIKIIFFNERNVFSFAVNREVKLLYSNYVIF